MKKILFSLILLTCFVFACKKKEPAAPDNTAVVTQTMTARPWNGDTGSVDVEVAPSYAFLLGIAGIDPNSLKNLSVDVSMLSVTFKTDNTFTGKDLTGQTISGQWQLLENGTKLKLTGANLQIPISIIPPNFQSMLAGVDLTFPDTYTIKELTDTKFVLYTEADRTVPITSPTSPTPIQVPVKLKITITLKRV